MATQTAEPMSEIVYDFVCLYRDTHGRAPSLREISASCYLGRSTVSHYLKQLEAQGRLSPVRSRWQRLRTFFP